MDQLRNMLNLNAPVDRQTQIALMVAVALIVNHHLELVVLPEIVTKTLKDNAVLLAIATVGASYIDLKYGVVMAALLYIAMDVKSEVVASTTETSEEKPAESVSEPKVSGNLAMPELEASENPLPTQDNSPPTEEHQVPHPENGTPDVDEKPYRMGVLEETQPSEGDEVTVEGWEGNNGLASA